MNCENMREKIVDATIICIGKYGIQSVTNRLIAKEADVNSAAINYYFGSKEDLLNEAMKHSLNNYFSEFLQPTWEGKSEYEIKQVLEKFLTDTVRDSIANPFFIKSYLYDTFVSNNYNGIFVDQFNLFLKQLCEPADNNDIGNRRELKMSILQIVSSLMFICLMPDFFKDFLNVDLKESDGQRVFIDFALNKYFMNADENRN
jgi:AcrR family transcriptional regulator